MHSPPVCAAVLHRRSPTRAQAAPATPTGVPPCRSKTCPPHQSRANVPKRSSLTATVAHQLPPIGATRCHRHRPPSGKSWDHAPRGGVGRARPFNAPSTGVGYRADMPTDRTSDGRLGPRYESEPSVGQETIERPGASLGCGLFLAASYARELVHVEPAALARPRQWAGALKTAEVRAVSFDLLGLGHRRQPKRHQNGAHNSQTHASTMPSSAHQRVARTDAGRLSHRRSDTTADIDPWRLQRSVRPLDGGGNEDARPRHEFAPVAW
jgi:hypothetical protein